MRIGKLGISQFSVLIPACSVGGYIPLIAIVTLAASDSRFQTGGWPGVRAGTTRAREKSGTTSGPAAVLVMMTGMTLLEGLT